MRIPNERQRRFTEALSAGGGSIKEQITQAQRSRMNAKRNQRHAVLTRKWLREHLRSTQNRRRGCAAWPPGFEHGFALYLIADTDDEILERRLLAWLRDRDQRQVRAVADA